MIDRALAALSEHKFMDYHQMEDNIYGKNLKTRSSTGKIAASAESQLLGPLPDAITWSTNDLNRECK